MLTKPWFKPFLRTAAFLLALLLAVQLAGHLLMPTSNRHLSGYTAGGVLGEDFNTIDVLVMGDSNAAQGIAPMEWYNDWGITGYTYGAGWLSVYNIYYRLQQIFREQSPRVVVVCTGPLYSKRGNDTFASAALREVSGELLPLLRFHDEWKVIHPTELFQENDYTWRDVNKGFAPITDVAANMANAGEWVYMNDLDSDPAYLPWMMKWYLKRVQRLCEQNGAELLLITVPACTSWSGARHNGTARLAEELRLTYLDYNLREEFPLGLDWRTDTPDAGSHLNVLGAEKLTDALGEYLVSHYSLPDHRGEAGYEDWDADAVLYQQDREAVWDRAREEAAHQLQAIGQSE